MVMGYNAEITIKWCAWQNKLKGKKCPPKVKAWLMYIFCSRLPLGSQALMRALELIYKNNDLWH